MASSGFRKPKSSEIFAEGEDEIAAITKKARFFREYRGLNNNYLYYFREFPYYADSIMGPQNPILVVKAPAIIGGGGGVVSKIIQKASHTATCQTSTTASNRITFSQYLLAACQTINALA